MSKLHHGWMCLFIYASILKFIKNEIINLSRSPDAVNCLIFKTEITGTRFVFAMGKCSLIHLCIQNRNITKSVDHPVNQKQNMMKGTKPKTCLLLLYYVTYYIVLCFTIYFLLVLLLFINHIY